MKDNKKGFVMENMVFFLKRSFLFLTLLTLPSGLLARDYFISGTGSGTEDGSGMENALPFNRLASLLSGYAVNGNDEDTKTLNLFFAAGTYDVPASGFTFGSRANVSELSVLFAPVDEDAEVIFSGAANNAIRFLVTTAFTSGTTEEAMQVTIEQVTIKDFSTSSGATNGTTSLFTIGAYQTAVSLKNVTLENIRSGRHPVILLGGNSASFDATECTFRNISVAAGNYPVFETQNTYSLITISQSTLENCTPSGTGYLFLMSSNNSELTLSDVKIKKGTSSNPQGIFSLTGSGSTQLKDVQVTDFTCAAPLISITNSSHALSLTDVDFSNNTVTGGNAGILHATNYQSLTIENSLFSHNTGTATGQSLFFLNTNNPSTIHNSTFENNQLTGNGTNQYIFRITASSGNQVLLYNNTFSGNTPLAGSNSTYGSILITASTTGGIFNNTFYDNDAGSNGGIRIEAAQTVRNNLLVNSGAIVASSTSNASKVRRNVYENIYYEDGTTSSPIQNISSYIQPLAPVSGMKIKVHPLTSVSDNPLLGKGGPLSDLGNYSNLLIFDQRGRKRPEHISLGAWDLPVFGVIEGRYTVLYDNTKPMEPSYQIDLATYITSYPEGKHADNISYEILTQPSNGNIILGSNGRYASFTPNMDNEGNPLPGVVGNPYEFTYRVYTSTGGVDYEATVKIKLTIININLPMGIIDQSIIECYTEMKQVNFAPEWKFRTRDMNIGSRFDGFSIPLVGDLNGDGKPEIVALGIANYSGTAVSLAGSATYIYILNGQTGEEIVKFPLPRTFTLRGPHHNSPSFMALVDSDRDGMVEIIMAYGDAGGSYGQRLVSYEVNENTFNEKIPVSDKSKLTEKWISNEQYNKYDGGYVSSSYYNVNMPLPQVVDIDGDGVPEVVVYNKIYSALDGRLLATLEDLGPASNHYTGRSNSFDAYKQYAFTGRNRRAPASYDSNINFTAVYDLDFDGKYEVIAGGKVYYDIDLENGTYKVKLAENISYAGSDSRTMNIGDGYTTVADINGDGKPEIIVAGNINSSSIQIQVWDPGLVVSDGNGGWVKAPDPENTPAVLLAHTTLPTYYRTGQGSMSYVYVGDIDGRVQNGKKFPEISILGSRFYATSSSVNNLTIPVHPNVAGELNSTISYSSSSVEGVLMSWTWDEDANGVDDRLKVSFILEHEDRSVNTGFTLFDFDNDGNQEICYRDEQTLRIISATTPFVRLGQTVDANNGPVRFSQPVKSYTGFEYPVIADIDGDGSADMVVMGALDRDADARGLLYALQADPSKTAFSPAPKVWNQFMYHPLKINEDLTTPLVNIHPLKMSYVLEKDAATQQRTYIYNNNITQVVVSAEFDGLLKPIVKTPDAVIEGDMDVTNSQMILYIMNRGDATLNALTPIRFFRGEVKGDRLLSTLDGQPLPTVIGTDVFVGDTLVLKIPVNRDNGELGENYVVRVTDASYIENGTFYDTFGKDEGLVDCNWADNWEIVGIFVLRDDPVTVMQHTTVEVDLFDNDDFPEGYTPVLTEDMITAMDQTNPIGSWKIVNNKFVYTAPGEYEQDVVEFKFKMTYETEGQQFVDSSMIYLFVLQSGYGDGMSACYGEPYTVHLKTSEWNPEFSWYNHVGEYMESAPTYPMDRDYVCYARPRFNGPKPPLTEGQTDYSLISFPAGRIVIYAIGQGEGEVVQAKWTGLVDSDWQNPANWAQIKDNKEEPILWIPNSCVDVILSKDALYYPTLRAQARTNNVVMEDRAMIAGVHLLHYDKVTVDLTLKPTEKERYVMWSSPLKGMVTGDYHFRNANDKPVWGDVHMNYFQAHNPDFEKLPGSVAKDHAFTADFGRLDDKLELGKGFNIRVLNQDTKATFRFPRTDTQYTDSKGTNYTINRDPGEIHKFIVDGLMDENGMLEMPVQDDPEYTMLQVVNPFMAYLNAELFLRENEESIEGAYKIWNGDVESNFVTLISRKDEDEDSEEYRFIADETELEERTNGFIPPLQSFFVMKKNPEKLEHLRISAAMTTTEHPDQASYELRSSSVRDEVEMNVLRVKAMQGEHTNMAILYFSPEAVPSYKSTEDSKKLFNPESPVSVYTLTSSQEPLAVYASADFSQDVRLGLRLKEAGDITLEFTNLRPFQHDVYLIDHDENNQIYDLNANPVRTFRVDASVNGNYIELNNRFSLHFVENPFVTGSEVIVQDDQLQVFAGNGTLYITAEGLPIHNLQIYNVSGQVVYASRKADTVYQIPVEKAQVYIVKGEINNSIKIAKVIAK